MQNMVLEGQATNATTPGNRGFDLHVSGSSHSGSSKRNEVAQLLSLNAASQQKVWDILEWYAHNRTERYSKISAPIVHILSVSHHPDGLHTKNALLDC
jgi:hypothetical protein